MNSYVEQNGDFYFRIVKNYIKSTRKLLNKGYNLQELEKTLRRYEIVRTLMKNIEEVTPETLPRIKVAYDMIDPFCMKKPV